MSTLNRDILISGAGVAGPVVAYWLRRYGFNPTVVEHAPTIRTAGPHAVDLWGAAVGIVERMGILSEVEAARTSNEIGVQIRPGRPAIELPVGELSTSFSDQGVEIPRFELTQLLYRAGSEEVEYIFGDSVAALQEDASGVRVTFEHAPPRRFDLVIGADGLHSNVRRLVFGPECGSGSISAATSPATRSPTSWGCRAGS